MENAIIKALCSEYNMDYQECRRWYDGYKMNDSISVYSPKSMVTAMQTGEYGNYWTTTGSYEALSNYILMDLDGIKADVISMLGGKNKECFIPNNEIRIEWINAIEEDGVEVVKVTAGSWMTASVNLANKINAKDAKKMKVIAKVGAGFSPADAIVFEFSSEDGKTTAISTWSVPTFMKDLSTSYKIYEVELSDELKAGKSDQGRQLAAVTGACDWSKISSIRIDPRGAVGDIYIRDIIFE